MRDVDDAQGDLRELPDELPEGLADRAAEQFLAAGEPQREAALAALLSAHPQHAAGLARLWAELGATDRLLDAEAPGIEATPAHIGGHRVISRLGEGAFGIVYLCAQEQPVVRRVAVKVLRPGAGDDKTLRRFAAERQLLATLNHPAITQIFDAGVMPDGRPYFVMEYVEGVAISSYCRTHALSCAERLRLFVELCRGVAHAHGRRIVHRDLKPANVLVVDTENGPRPKVIDFGIAKVLFTQTANQGSRTDAGRVIGTPGYMSPEQAAGHADVDERADVFALGVMLYELLTDALPWAQGALATDTDPVRPSARVTTTAHEATAPPAPQRRKLAAELRGDLDWITLKALARERDQRYATVTDLLQDVERHLRGETVSAGPPSASYRLRKFVRRNRALVVSLGSATVMLGLGLGGAWLYGANVKSQAAAARTEAAASFGDALAAVDRLLAQANDPRFRDVPKGDAARQSLLGDALSFYDRFLKTRPGDTGLRVSRCQALLSIAQVHLLLGEMARAGELAGVAAEEAAALFAAEPGSIDRRALLAASLRKQGLAAALAGNRAGAHPKLEAAADHLAVCAAAAPLVHGRDHAAVLREAADALAPHLGEQRLLGKQQSVQVLEALLRDHPDAAGLVDDHVDACIVVAAQLVDLRRYDDAKAILATADAELPKVEAERARQTTRIRQQQGRCAWSLGDRPAAIRYEQDAVEAATRWMLEQPQRLQPQEQLTRSLRDLGTSQNYFGAFDDSDISYRRAIAQADAMVQQFPEDPSRQTTLARLLRMYSQVRWDRFRRQDLDEAAACAARATAVNDRVPPSVDMGRQPRWLMLAMEAGIAESLGKDAGAIWQAVEADLPTDPEVRQRQDQNQIAMAFRYLAEWHRAGGRVAEARHFVELAHEAIARNKPESDRLLVDLGWIEGQMAFAAGDHAAAAAAADRILAARSTWFACRRAADCLHLAWRLAAAAPAPDAALLAGYRERALKLYGNVLDTLIADVAKDPLDPWYVLPWGFASVRTAELVHAAGNTELAVERLREALPKLEGVHAAAHADQWDELTVADGKALLLQLTSR